MANTHTRVALNDMRTDSANYDIGVKDAHGGSGFRCGVQMYVVMYVPK